VSTPNYGEVLFQRPYPGNTNSCEVLKQTIKEVERILGPEEERRKSRWTLIRIDGGFGTDENLNWLMWAATSSSPKATGESGPTS
jgi:hypothetical protein